MFGFIMMLHNLFYAIARGVATMDAYHGSSAGTYSAKVEDSTGCNLKDAEGVVLGRSSVYRN